MEKPLFSVSCTTCRARLAVRHKEALGKILECPKCGSMVLISPPEGWVLREEPSPTREKALSAEKPGSPVSAAVMGAAASEKPGPLLPAGPLGGPPIAALSARSRRRPWNRRRSNFLSVRTAQVLRPLRPLLHPMCRRAPGPRLAGRGARGARRCGCSDGLYAFRAPGGHCRGDVPDFADAIALGSRGRAGGFRPARFDRRVGGRDGGLPSSPRCRYQAQRPGR